MELYIPNAQRYIYPLRSLVTHSTTLETFWRLPASRPFRAPFSFAVPGSGLNKPEKKRAIVVLNLVAFLNCPKGQANFSQHQSKVALISTRQFFEMAVQPPNESQ